MEDYRRKVEGVTLSEDDIYTLELGIGTEW